MNTKEYIELSKSIHGNLYNYDNTEYINATTKVIINCTKHGDFQKLPAKHTSGQQGCPVCSKEKPRSNPDTTLHEARTQFGDKFTYDFTNYKNRDSTIAVTCPEHGKYSTTMRNHLKSSHGCSKCGIQSAGNSKRSNLKTFIAKARVVHGDFYDYSQTVYVEAKKKLTIVCPHHGPFEQLASGHLSGYGCKHCASHGKGRVDMNKPCKVYYFKVAGTELYKIGITAKSLDHRYRTAFDKDQIELLFTKEFDTGREAYNYEQKIIADNQSSKYLGEKVLKTGNTELFTRDVFNGIYPNT